MKKLTKALLVSTSVLAGCASASATTKTDINGFRPGMSYREVVDNCMSLATKATGGAGFNGFTCRAQGRGWSFDWSENPPEQPLLTSHSILAVYYCMGVPQSERERFVEETAQQFNVEVNGHPATVQEVNKFGRMVKVQTFIWNLDGGFVLTLTMDDVQMCLKLSSPAVTQADIDATARRLHETPVPKF